MQGTPELVLLGLAPEPAKPHRRREARVEKRHDKQRDDVRGKYHAFVLSDGARHRADYDHNDQAGVSEAERAEPRALHRRPADRRPAQPEDWLRDTDNPRRHDRRQRHHLEWRVYDTGVGWQSGDDPYGSDDRDADRDDRSSGGAERDERVSKEEQEVAREQEDHQRNVRDHLGADSKVPGVRPDEDDQGQEDKGQDQVRSLRVAVPDPVGQGGQRQQPERDLDRNAQVLEHDGHPQEDTR